MSKMTILSEKACSSAAGCAFEEYRNGMLRRCGKDPIVKTGRANLCLEHMEYALSCNGGGYELFDQNNCLHTQKRFLELARQAAAEPSHDD
jgi:hypothetical protein